MFSSEMDSDLRINKLSQTISLLISFTNYSNPNDQLTGNNAVKLHGVIYHANLKLLWDTHSFLSSVIGASENKIIEIFEAN